MIADMLPTVYEVWPLFALWIGVGALGAYLDWRDDKRAGRAP